MKEIELSSKSEISIGHYWKNWNIDWPAAHAIPLRVRVETFLGL